MRRMWYRVIDAASPRAVESGRGADTAADFGAAAAGALPLVVDAEALIDRDEVEAVLRAVVVVPPIGNSNVRRSSASMSSAYSPSCSSATRWSPCQVGPP
jgi:hypothetical protein